MLLHPVFRSSAAARTKADRWQLEEQRRRQGHHELQQLITHHHIKAANGTPLSSLRHSPPFCPALRHSETATTILHHDNLSSDMQPLCFLRFGW